VEDIEIDPDSGDIWVVGKNGLSRWDVTGQLLLETNTKKLTLVFSNPKGIAKLGTRRHGLSMLRHQGHTANSHYQDTP